MTMTCLLKIKIERSGMTLLEVMVALMLFSIGIISVAAMINVSMLSNGRAQESVKDTIAAAVSLEHILALDYDDSRLEDRDNGFHPQDPDHGPMVLIGKSSTIEWEVERDFPAHNAKRVQITIRNTGNHGASKGQQYDYIKARNLTFKTEE